MILGTRKSPEIVETIVEPVLRALQEWGVTFDVIRTEASKHAVSIARSCRYTISLSNKTKYPFYECSKISDV
jgi:hypothetical protein